MYAVAARPAITLITTPLLEIACEISGPQSGPALFLLHGWPDDAQTWDRVLPALHAAGWRTYVPYLRGVGATRFRDPATPRNGQLSALAQDLLEVVGHDWGARAAYIASCLAPQRITHCVALSVGWGTNDPNQRLSLQQTRNYWYQWYLALDRGAALIRDERQAFTAEIWHVWNPGWCVPQIEFEATAASFENPDWAEVALHSYRVRWGLAPTSPCYAPLEQRLAVDPQIHVPTLVLHGALDPCNDPSTSADRHVLFTGPYVRQVLDNVGHFPQRQDPTRVSGAILAHLAAH